MSHTPLLEDNLFMSAFADLMKTSNGRYAMHRLLAVFGIRQSAFVESSRLHARASGFQEAGFLLEDILEHANGEMYLLMLKEKHDENAIERAKAERRNKDE